VLAAQIPNAITVARIALVLPTAWLLWEGRYVQALILMSIAGASDAVDGWLARRLQAVSQFGAALDPVADKLLVAAMFVILTVQGHLPLWLAVVILGRDAVILTGAAVYRVLFGQLHFSPTYLSKANTALQIAMALLLMLWLCEFGAISDLAAMIVDPYGFYLLAALGLASGVDYVVTWSLRAWREARAS
jgi:cardiolipin synthase (CMP-forming)